MKPQQHFYQVYLEDTDMMGIVYHANYLKFFERARSDTLRIHGFSLTNVAIDDTYFAIKTLSIDYKSPARLEDELSILTEFKAQGFCQLIFSQKMYNSAQVLLSSLEVNVVCVNSQMKPKPLPKHMIKEFFA
jgi:acyl-CoA thioester hydrolase